MWSFSCAARTLINLEVRPNQHTHCKAGCISSLGPSFLWNKLSSHLETQTKHVPELAPMLVPARLGENWLLIADLKCELTTNLILKIIAGLAALWFVFCRALTWSEICSSAAAELFPRNWVLQWPLLYVRFPTRLQMLSMIIPLAHKRHH